jgi:serine/threonine protein kinase/tetratricopeptide (TPR) repeat protein
MVGTRVAQFEIRARLGQGGMGEVYLADDTALRRKVALKFVTPTAAADAEAGRRLQQEAYAVAALDHPFICKVFEAGEHEGQRYIAMEYVEGQTLKDRLDAGPLPPADVTRIAREIAEALEFAHARGIVHRDLKPANVILSPDGHTKVMDFGIAKRLTAPGGDWTTVAEGGSGNATGTLAYMSPEQVRGEQVDTRSDIFAFGVVVHELLTGTHPFRRNSAFDTAEAIVHEAPPSLPAGVADASPALAGVTVRCLEKKREDRFATFGEIRSALAETASTVPRVAPSRRRRRTILIAAAAVIAVALVAGWLRPDWMPFSKPALAFGARDWIVIADVENLTGDKLFDRSLGAALDVAIAQSKYVNVFPRDRIQAGLFRMRKPRDAALDEALAIDLAAREGARAVLVCTVAQVGDAYSLTARVVDPRTKTAVIRASRQAATRDRLLGALNDLAADVRRQLGESITQLSAQSKPLPEVTTASLDALRMFADSYRVSDPNTAVQLLRQAIDLDPDFAPALAALGYQYYAQGSRDSRTEGDKLMTKALSLSNRLTTRERLWIQAMYDDARGNREQAVIGFKAYLAQYPDDTRALFRLGWTSMAVLRKFDDARDAFTKLIEIDPRNTSALINLATVYNGGLTSYERAVEIYQKAFAISPDEMLGNYVNGEYGSALIRLGRTDEARQAFEKMANAPDALRQARGRRSLAFLAMYLGRYHDAAAELRQAAQVNESNQYYLSAFRDRILLATAHLGLGERDAALKQLAAVDGLGGKLTLGPEWLVHIVRLRAQVGQIDLARKAAALIAKAAGNTFTDTAVTRNLSEDPGYVNLARGIIELAQGHAEPALAALDAAGARLGPEEVRAETGRALFLAGRLPEAAAKLEPYATNPPIGYEAQEEAFRALGVLGTIYERLGQTDKAKALYGRFISQRKEGDADGVLLKQIKDRLKAIETGKK